MKWLRYIPVLFIAVPAFAGNLTGYWYSDGGLKEPAEQFYPYGGCSSCTIGPVWNGSAITQSAAKNETIGGAYYLLNGGPADATNVMVTVSSLTCQGGTGIVNTITASSMTVWNTNGRPTQLFKAAYILINGISQLYYGDPTFEERQIPQRFQTPCTLQAGGNCTPNSGTNTYANRPDGNTHYPIGLVPIEEWSANGSSFTVTKSSSQVVWIDTYISTGIMTGMCTGYVSTYEGSVISTVTPYYINVGNFALPTQFSFPALAVTGGSVGTQESIGSDINFRQNNQAFPPAGNPYLTSREHYYMMAHAHGLIPMGDFPDVPNNYFPSAEFKANLNGTQYSPANGYANARGINSGDGYYVLGVYSGPFQSQFDPAWSTWTFGGANGFDTVASSWVANLSVYHSTGIVYTPYDETDGYNLSHDVNKFSAWLSTVPTAAYNGQRLGFMQTGDLPVVSASAPYVNYPFSVYCFDDFAPSSTTWQNLAAMYASTATLGRYNDNWPCTAGVQEYEQEGYEPRENFFSFWLKGVQMYDTWETTYFLDGDNGGRNNNLYQDALTFGYFTSTDTVFGADGFNFTMGQGILFWYGNDVGSGYSNPYGFDGPIATWQLKMMRRGLNDIDYMKLAYAVNPSSTTNLVREIMPSVLWEQSCVENHPGGDCSYYYGGKGWSINAHDYTNAILSMATIIESNPSPPPSNTVSVQFSGPLKITFPVQVSP